MTQFKMKSAMKRVSKLFIPAHPIPKSLNNTDLIKSQRLMIEQGIIKPSSTGLYTLLPLGMRALAKLKGIVDHAMENIGAHEVLLPALTSEQLWKQSGRLEAAEGGSEIFFLKDRHQKRYLLGPTHEESITELLTGLTSYRKLPLLFYQISNKYRDEPRPRFGLIRTREFVMKDLYSFDASDEDALKTYESVTEAYNKIFDKLGVKYIRVEGDSGMMGGQISHEFHYPCDIGEEQLVSCQACNYSASKAVIDPSSDTCSKCQSNQLVKTPGIEVGHTFLLGTRYSKAFNATSAAADGKMHPLVMGCYGLGLTRILAASLEALSLPSELRWPQAIAPYKVCIITPKHGSREEPASALTQSLYDLMELQEDYKGDIIVDDRTDLSIGRRLQDAKRLGYPLIVVIGKKAVEDVPRFEVYDLLNNQEYEWTDGSLLAHLQDLAQATV